MLNYHTNLPVRVFGLYGAAEHPVLYVLHPSGLQRVL